MHSLIGFIGAAFFAFCGIPQCYQVYVDGNADGISLAFILMQIGGNIFSAIYIFQNNLKTRRWMLPQYMNYSIAFICMLYLLVMKLST